VTTNPADHQAGVEQVTISLPKRGLPAPTNHQIPVLTKQVPGLVEITMEMEHVISKKVFHRQKENLTRAGRNPVTLRYAALQVIVHSHAEVQKADQREVLVTSGQAKGKALLQGGKLLTQISQHQKADQKEALVMSRQEKRKAILREEKHLIQAGQHQKTDQKEALAESLLKENLLVSQVLKAGKGLRIENPAAVHQKIQDIRHSENQLIHLTTNLHLRQNAVRRINHYVQERNLLKNLV